MEKKIVPFGEVVARDAVDMMVRSCVGATPILLEAEQQFRNRQFERGLLSDLPQGAKGMFPLRLGTIRADIVGGPYRMKPSRFYGIKMAAEIEADCVVSIPTVDYEVPDTGRLLAGLYAGISLAQQGAPLWVGCMGGIGRTGLYFAALAKVMAGYQKLMKHKPCEPITYVRSTYYSHAVETDAQRNWIWHLDVDAVVQWVAHLQGYRSPWYRRLLRAL